MATNTYNETTDLILGEELLLYVKEGTDLIPVAYATSHALSLNADSIDTSSKFSGVWKTAFPGQIGWTITAESLISRSTGHMSFQTLAKKAAKRVAIEVVIAQRKETPLDTEDQFAADEAKTWYSGLAYITALDKKADRGAICTSSITLQGAGALKGATGANLELEP